MEIQSTSPKTLIGISLALICIAVHPTAGSIIARPIEYSLTMPHVIVTGQIVDTTRDKKVKIEPPHGKPYTNYYRLGTIKVDEVLKNDLVHFTTHPGDRVLITLGPTAKGYRQLQRKRRGDRRFIDTGAKYRLGEIQSVSLRLSETIGERSTFKWADGR